MDYKTIRLTNGSLLKLSKRHVIDNISIGSNCEAVAIVISRKLMQSCIRDTPVIKKILTATGRIHTAPILQLNEEEIRHITDIIMRIKKYLNMPEHAFQSHIVRYETGIFIMEAAHTYLQRLGIETQDGDKENRKNEIIRKFNELIIKHHKEQHAVLFYAEQMRITPAYLSRTVSAASGKSPLQWIGSALITEAKILLRKPDTTIKQVAYELNFGDQSSFVKFFRRHAGMTPMEYRNEMQKEK